MMQQQQQQQPIITIPTANDVLCGRGKSCNNHSGNIQFISIVKDHVQTYMNLSSRFEKTLLVRNLVDKIKNEYGVQFLKKSSTSSSSLWYPLNEDESNAKVGHAIRDMIKTNRKKSNNNNNNNKSSQAIKKMKQQQQQQQMTPITATTTICFEPIQCHSTEDLCDHCITARSLSLKTSDLLTSILNVVETTTAKEDDEVNDCDCLSTEMLMMTALPTPLPTQRTRYVSEESCAFPPAPVLSSSSSSSSSLLLYDDRRSPSFCVVKAFGLDRIDSNEDECYSNRIMNDDLGTIFQI